MATDQPKVTSYADVWTDVADLVDLQFTWPKDLLDRMRRREQVGARIKAFSSPLPPPPK